VNILTPDSLALWIAYLVPGGHAVGISSLAPKINIPALRYDLKGEGSNSHQQGRGWAGFIRSLEILEKFGISKVSLQVLEKS
jgi:hypothetical protein